MKTCSKCKIPKSYDQFHKRGNGLKSACIDCVSDANSKKWAEDAEMRKKKQHLQDQRRWRNRDYIYQYLQDKSCKICGETDPVLFDFDHVDPKEKDMSISKMAKLALSIDRIKTEIEKCQILCVSCHRRKTAEQQGWFRRTVNAGLILQDKDQLLGR